MNAAQALGPEAITALVLALIVVLASRRFGRGRPGPILLQALAAVALYLLFFPPTRQAPGEVLVLATAQTSPAQVAAHRRLGPVLALPEAPRLAEVETVPDLATALRRHPQARGLRVLGAGLEARDRDAVGTRALAFDPPPLRPGLVELQAPTEATVGQPWTLRGRVHDIAGARVELIDPAGRRLAHGGADRAGVFALSTAIAVAGPLELELRLLDAQGRTRERLPMPVQVLPGRKPRLWLMSGGPDPDLKYLRRWAHDADFELRARIALGAGVMLGDPIRLDPDSLRAVDLLVLDERAWRGLGVGQRAALQDAVDTGLGLMLRLQGPMSVGERESLRPFGFDVAADRGAVELVLPGTRAPAPGEPPTPLSRRRVEVQAGDAATLLRDGEGTPLGLWRAQGLGRVGLWWLGDSYRLALSGQAPLHGQLWSGAVARLARADALSRPRLASEDPRPQQRALVCDLTVAASVLGPDGRRDRLLTDRDSGCAAWWPARAGWHRVEAGTTQLPIWVRAAGEAPGVQARIRREQTLRLVSAQAAVDRDTVAVPGPRWPWFLAWLLLSALGWWRERAGQLSGG